MPIFHDLSLSTISNWASWEAVTLNEEVTQLTAAMANATEMREKATESHGRCGGSKGVVRRARRWGMVLESAQNVISQLCN